MAPSFSCQAVVLKRINYQDADRIVTLYTKEYGKITGLAKGARKITSKRIGVFEPATEARFFLVKTKSFDLITQAKLIRSHNEVRENLVKMTQTYQLLEIIDLLTAPESANGELYDLLLNGLDIIEKEGTKKKELLELMRLILKSLGFTYDKVFTEYKLKEYIEELAGRKLKSKQYLT